MTSIDAYKYFVERLNHEQLKVHLNFGWSMDWMVVIDGIVTMDDTIDFVLFVS